MTKARKNFINSILSKKKGAEEYLQGVGSKIRKNIIQGQIDHKNRKNNSGYYKTINPLKDVF